MTFTLVSRSKNPPCGSQLCGSAQLHRRRVEGVDLLAKVGGHSDTRDGPIREEGSTLSVYQFSESLPPCGSGETSGNSSSRSPERFSHSSSGSRKSLGARFPFPRRKREGAFSGILSGPECQKLVGSSTSPAGAQGRSMASNEKALADEIEKLTESLPEGFPKEMYERYCRMSLRYGFTKVREDRVREQALKARGRRSLVRFLKDVVGPSQKTRKVGSTMCGKRRLSALSTSCSKRPYVRASAHWKDRPVPKPQMDLTSSPRGEATDALPRSKRPYVRASAHWKD